MNTLTYCVPASLIPGFHGQRIIVRSDDPAEIVAGLADPDPESISFVRLLSLERDMDCLMTWGYAIPVELVVSEISRDLPLLYRYAPLLAVHPIRVSVPLVSGFGNVVKLAVSLNFAVKLEGGQPDETLMDEMQQIADLYLHQSMVSVPIEFFHSLFMVFYHREPLTLWTIQEEDPALVRYITDQGEERMPGCLIGMAADDDFFTFLQELQKGECTACEFLPHCQGYFKWPRRQYNCDGVKVLMRTLWTAAEELRADVASFQSPEEGERT